MRPDHLLQIAAGLADVSARRPRRTDLCRATSAAYYALFHCLARAGADTLAGRAGGSRSRAAWRQVYRALEHGQAKRRCGHPAMREFPAAIRDFAETFVSLQNRRHLADYDPDFPFRKSGVQEDIQRAQVALPRFAEAPREHRRAFAIHVSRPSSNPKGRCHRHCRSPLLKHLLPHMFPLALVPALRSDVAGPDVGSGLPAPRVARPPCLHGDSRSPHGPYLDVPSSSNRRRRFTFHSVPRRRFMRVTPDATTLRRPGSWPYGERLVPDGLDIIAEVDNNAGTAAG